MWDLLLLCLPLPGLGMPLHYAKMEPSQVLQNPGPSLGSPVTPTLLPPHSEAPALLLNLGPRFQGGHLILRKEWPDQGLETVGTRPSLLPTLPAVLAQPQVTGSCFSAEDPGGAGPAEQHPSGPPVEAEAGSGFSSTPPTLGPPAQPLHPTLNFQVGFDVTTRPGQGKGPAPSSHVPPELLLTGFQAGTSLIASPPGAPGPESSCRTAFPGSQEASAALPGCSPGRPEDCGSHRPPKPGVPLLSSPPHSSSPLLLTLHSDWDAALAEWGLAWEVQVYGAGCLFALLALLSLLGLLALPCLSLPDAKRLALLQLPLLAAGAARAGLLLGEARGLLELIPGPAVQLLHELALPCLTSALAAALRLLSLRTRWRPSCLLAVLLLLHFALAAGSSLADDLLPPRAFLLLVSRGCFALLAALLSGSCLLCSCLPRGEPAQVCSPMSVVSPACRCLRPWSSAACASVAAASFGLLSSGLHTYSLLQALGYGLNPVLLGAWPWWALQLSCQLCEVGTGLPLSVLGLHLLFRLPSTVWCRCSPLSLDRAAEKGPALSGSHQWTLSQQENQLELCHILTTGESDCLPLHVTVSADFHPGPGAETCSRLSFAVDASDPTADFHPPSPIDLRRSIDEALCSEGLLQCTLAVSASRILSLGNVRELTPDSASLTELVPAQSPADGGVPLDPLRASSTLSSSRGGPSWSSPSGPFRTSPSSHRTNPCGRPLQRPLPPLELPRVCLESLASVEQPVGKDRQMDSLSLGSDTMDL